MRLDALRRIDYQQRPFTGGQRAADLVVEIHVAGGIDEVELVGLAVFRGVIQRDAVGLDGDPALAFQIHRVQYLGGHLPLGEPPTDLDEAVGKRRLAVVDMGNN